ncbi:MAG: DUF2341 domain-containing protein [Candidatus Dojkabacteria bacterium]|nr:MAG: DUF2341 domain-containing protein [Candidatus Dojkabacteria bacterium]
MKGQININKIWKWLGQILPVSLFFVLLGWVSFTKSVNASWFNELWRYRQRVALGSVTTELSGYQVQLTGINTQSLYNAGKIKANCEDLRFTDNEGKLLEYWIEDDGTTCQNDTSTDVWVKTTRLAIGGTAIYMYYGNPGAEAYQSPHNTFEFFDGFDSATLDSSIWASSQDPAISSGKLLLNNDKAVRSYATFAANSRIIVRASQQSTGLRNGYLGFSNAVLSSSYIADDAMAYQFDSSTGGNFEVVFGNEGTTSTDTLLLPENSSDNEFEIGWLSSRIDFFANNDLHTSTSSATHIADESLNIRMENSSATETLSIDWVAVAKYAASLPATTSFGTEEKGNGPVVYLDFDESAGTTAFDKSGSGNNGTLVNDPSRVSDCIKGNCLNFDGTNDLVTVANNPSFNFGSGWTISAWVNPATSQTTSPTIFRYGTSASSEVFILDAPSGLWRVAARNTSNVATIMSTSEPMVPNKWVYVVATFNGSTLSLWLDGKLIATQAFSGTPKTIGNTTIAIGNSPENSNALLRYRGQIDEVKIYDRALSQSDIYKEFSLYHNVLGASANIQRDGLAAWWKMDEALWNGTSGEVIDSSLNGNNGSRGGNVTTSGGTLGNAGIFDGNDDYVVTSYMLPTNNGTMAAWLSTTAPATTQVVIGQESLTAATENGIKIVTSKIQCQKRTATDTILLTSATTVVANTWYHAVCTYSSVDGVKLYVNGVLEAQSTDKANLTANGTFRFHIGAHRHSGGYVSDFSGKIDDVRIYTRAISGEEAKDIYTFTPPSTGTWKFDETIGTSFADTSLSQFTGTLTNTVDSDWTTGKIGNAIRFDGSTSYGTVTHDVKHNILAGGSFTISAWVKTNGTISAVQHIVGKGGSSAGGVGYNLYFTAAGNIACGIDDDATSFPEDVATSASDYDDSNWHFVICTKTQARLEVYVDGLLAGADTSLSSTGSLANTENLRFGGQGTSYFNGILDEVNLYTHAMPYETIQRMYSQQRPTYGVLSTNGLVGYWKFDETSGTAVTDGSGLGNHGTAVNGASITSGISGNARDFSGSSQYISFSSPSGIPLGGSQYSISAWFWADSGGSRGIVGWGNFGASNQVNALRLDETCCFRHYWWGNDLDVNVGSTTGKWNHVVVTYDGATRRLYFNGAQAGSLNSSSINVPHANNLRIGSTNNGEFFDGRIDELSIWNRPLSAGEISLLYNMQSVSSIAEGSNKTLSVTTEVQSKGSVMQLLFDHKSGAVASDSSGNNYAGTLQNMSASSWVKGYLGSALSFDGDNDYVSFANSSVANVTGSTMTISFWLYPKTFAHQNTIIHKDQQYSFNIDTSGNVAWAESSNFSYSNFGYSNIGLVTNQWQHVMLVKNGSNIKIYRNGILRAEKTFGGNLSSTGNILAVGCYFYSGVCDNIVDQNFEGMLDTLKIWNTALSPRDAAIEYNAGMPIGYWKFDRGEGNIAHDYSGNAFHGTLMNMDPANDWLAASNCKFNACLDFDGSNDYISVPDDNALDFTSTMSISMWIYQRSAIANGYRIVDKGTAGLDNGLNFDTYNGVNGRGLRLCGAGGCYTASGQRELNRWYHVALVFNNGTLQFYIDGKLDTSTTTTNPVLFTNNLDLRIGAAHVGCSGACGNTEYFNGRMDDVRIYSYPLTENDIKRDYNLGAALRFE